MSPRGNAPSRTDSNHAAMLAEFRRLGATVTSTAMVGHGFPDLVIGYGGCNQLVEVKDGAKVPSARKLSPDEIRWQEQWRGDCVIVARVEECDWVLTAMVER